MRLTTPKNNKRPFSGDIRLLFSMLVFSLIWSVCASAEVMVPVSVGNYTTFIPVNAEPIANNDVFSFPEQHAYFKFEPYPRGGLESKIYTDNTFDLNVLDNDTDKSIETVTIEIVTPLSNLNHTLDVSGTSIKFTPQHGGYVGRDTFEYRLVDEDGLVSNVAKVTIDMVEANDPPIAATDKITIVEDIQWCNEANADALKCSASVDFLINDFDPESSTISFERLEVFLTFPFRVDTQGSTGGFNYAGKTKWGYIRVAGSQLTYTPNAEFFEPKRRWDYFFYVVKDQEGLETRGQVDIHFNGFPNSKPEVFPLDVKTGSVFSEKETVTIDVLATDDAVVEHVEYKKGRDGEWKSARSKGNNTYAVVSRRFSVGRHVYYVRATDDDDVESEELKIAIDIVEDRPPQVNIVSPQSGQDVEVLNPLVVEIIAEDDGIVENVKASLDASTWVDGIQNNGIYSVTLVPDTVRSNQTIRVEATDDSGQITMESVTVDVVDQPANPAPEAILFEWQPQTVTAGTPSLFKWNIANVRSCERVMPDGSRLPQYPLSGEQLDSSIKLPGSHTIQWQCIDLDGATFPATGFLEATLTVEKMPPPNLTTVN